MCPRSFRRALAVAVLVAVPATPASAAPVVTGLNVNAHWLPEWNATINASSEVSIAAESHASWIRMSISWNALESSGPRAYERTGSQEQRALTQVARAVDDARARGLRVLLFVDSTPSWANGTGSFASDLPPVPARYADYAAFMGRMATLFAGRVGAWQVWNEPNLSQFWRVPDASAYGRLVAATTLSLRAADPAALVVSAGLSPDGADSYAFISQAMAAGMAGGIDRLGLHAYPGTTPESCRTRTDGLPVQKDLCAIPALVSRARGYQPALTAWVTEIGWSTYAHPGWGNYASESDQAVYLTRADAVLGPSETVERAFWYGLHDLGTDVYSWSANLGLVRNDYTRKPSFGAFAKLNQATAPAPAPAPIGGTPVNSAPSASFTFSPSAPVAGTAVTFTGVASDADGSIAASAWDLDNDGRFDDGTGSRAGVTYTKAGTYRVSWRVTDDRGLSAVSSRDVSVLSLQKAKRLSRARSAMALSKSRHRLVRSGRRLAPRRHLVAPHAHAHASTNASAGGRARG